MNELDFKPKLIGQNYAAIEKETENWEHVIYKLNDLQVGWKSYFNEPLTPQLVKDVLSVPQSTITFFIKERFIQLDPELSKLVKVNRIKIEKLIEITDFPDCIDLQEEIKYLSEFIKTKFRSGIHLEIERIYEKKQFFFPDEIKTEIKELNTYFTTNENENIVLEKVKAICENINFFNNLGANITDADLPRAFTGNVETIKGSVKFGELKGACAGNPRYHVPRLVPHWIMFKKEGNALLQSVENNHHCKTKIGGS